MAHFLHELNEFPALLQIIEEETGILSTLVEKDYWLMHVLYGLQKQGFDFNLKGGTSLSKGYGAIKRFSEDIDIFIKPPDELQINSKGTSQTQIDKRKEFYDQLCSRINIPGIISVERDHEFDDKHYYRSGGIRLYYKSFTESVSGLKDGILLEAGFDQIAPFEIKDISSWAFETANENKEVNIIDNRAIGIPCYHPGYTFVEKLQTIATKYRQDQASGNKNKNFMRQYYDIYCLLDLSIVQDFIGTDAYKAHKRMRFPKADFEIPIAENPAFLLDDTEIRKSFEERYQSTSSLYYQGQPLFDEVINRIRSYIDRL